MTHSKMTHDFMTHMTYTVGGIVSNMGGTAYASVYNSYGVIAEVFPRWFMQQGEKVTRL